VLARLRELARQRGDPRLTNAVSSVENFVQEFKASSSRGRRELRLADAERALREANQAGIVSPRIGAVVVDGAGSARFLLGAQFEKPLGIELVLRARDGDLGRPERRVPLPESLAPKWRASALEPGLVLRLLDGEVANGLAELAPEALRMDDNEIAVEIDATQTERLPEAIRVFTRIVELIDARRRTLPKSDHADEVARVWREVAEMHQGEFDRDDERLLLNSPLGALDVYVARVHRTWCTIAELVFGNEPPDEFELLEAKRMGWRAWFQRPILSDPGGQHVLFVRGSRKAARAIVESEAKASLVELLDISDWFRFSQRGLLVRVDRVLTDAAELDRILDLVLQVGEAVGSRGRVHGPYR